MWRGGRGGRRALGLSAQWRGPVPQTDDYRDAWFVGFSDSVVAAVKYGVRDITPAPIARDAYAARGLRCRMWTDS